MIARLILTLSVITMGTILLASSQLLRRQPPPFDGIGQTPFPVWVAFNIGLFLLGLAAIGLAIAAGWRTLASWRRQPTDEPMRTAPRRPGVFARPQASPASRYLVDVGISLFGSICILAGPVLMAGGSPVALLASFVIPLAILCLAAGGLISVVRG